MVPYDGAAPRALRVRTEPQTLEPDPVSTREGSRDSITAVVVSKRHTGSTAVAMDARGFGAATERTLGRTGSMAWK